jgi:hypothetical protein
MTCVSVDGDANGNVVVGTEVDEVSIVVDGADDDITDEDGAAAAGADTPDVSIGSPRSVAPFPHDHATKPTSTTPDTTRHPCSVVLMPSTCAPSWMPSTGLNVT